MSTQVDIEDLNDTHLDEIAELTYTTEDFAAFVSLLGLAYLKNVYIKNILEIAFGFVVKIDGKFAGFLISTDDLKSYFNHITSKRKLQSLPYVIKFAIFHPLAFINLLRVKLFLKEYETMDVNAELVLFAVKQEYRSTNFLKTTGINVSKLLMEETLAEFQRRKTNKIKLEVPSNNILAQVFYRSFGFVKESEIEFNKAKRNIYVKTL